MHAKPEAPVAATLAIDLAKDVFELGFADARGKLIQRQRRTVFASRLDNRAPLRIVMEACGSAHYWARRFTRLGHQVALLPAHQPVADAEKPALGASRTGRTGYRAYVIARSTEPSGRTADSTT